MKLICIGRNYTAHIEELENEKPTDPVVFLKPDTSILLKKFLSNVFLNLLYGSGLGSNAFIFMFLNLSAK